MLDSGNAGAIEASDSLVRIRPSRRRKRKGACGGIVEHCSMHPHQALPAHVCLSNNNSVMPLGFASTRKAPPAGGGAGRVFAWAAMSGKPRLAQDALRRGRAGDNSGR